MKYEIIGSVMPLLQLQLGKEEVIACQSGSMKWMDEAIEMQTKMAGGLGGFLKRAVVGESGFLNYYRAKRDGARIALGHTYPGKIIPISVGKHSIVCQKRAFLASEAGVDLEITFQKRLGTGLFGGEGFIMQKLKGEGMAFVEIDGEVAEVELQRGESIKAETGAVAMFEDTVSMSVETVKGVSNLLFGGEGLFLTLLTGPGKVWIQTLSISSLAAEIYPYLPIPKSK